MGRDNTVRGTRRRSRWLAGVLAIAYLAVGAGAALGAAGGSTKSTTPGSPTSPGGTTVSPGTGKTTPTTPIAAPPTGLFSDLPKPPEKPETKEAQDDPAAPSGPATIQATPMVDGKVDFHAKNEDLANVLELLSREYQVNIVTSRNAKGKVTVDLYKVTVEQILDAICRANALQWSREGGSIYVCTPEEAKAAKTDESRLTTEVFPLNFLTADDAAKLIAPAMSPKATVAVNTASEVGIPTGSDAKTGGNSFGLGDSLVVRDYPENLDQVRKILKQMDRRPRQVLVEATLLGVTLNDTTSLGIDINTLAGIDFRDLSNAAGPITTTPAADPTVMPNAADTLAPTPWRGGKKGPGSWANLYSQGFASPGTGLNVGIITNNIALFIHALEEVTDTTVLSNPKVLALNKQRAEVMVGDRFGYRTTTTTETTTVQTIQFLDTGTQLVFRPFISDDGYIRMEIHPKVSSGAVDANGLPTEHTTEVTCNIMVKDGHTIVIGGLFNETESVGRSLIPGLGNIPGIGWLFRSNSDSTVRREIIVLLTPHVIEDDEAANAIGEAAMADAKRRCLGMREGFSWLTRERITTLYMQEADRFWQRYEKSGWFLDRCLAWWNVHMTLNVSPNNLKALRLKDKVLSGKDGTPYQPPNWTIWDSIGDRLKEMDKAKAAADKAPAARTAETPAAPPEKPAEPPVPAAPQENPTPAPKENPPPPADRPAEAPKTSADASQSPAPELAAKEMEYDD